ncbi:MAG: phosphatidate cytidylyltransferase [Alphaproteobacteria bacterium]|nr:MAG: phosphatidate cytidylyltransferase [Alphaproteobacteria bacterium]
MTAESGRFGDLALRLGSGLAIAGAGLAAVWYGGPAFSAIVALLAGLMVWELAAMVTDSAPPGRAQIVTGAAATLVVILSGALGGGAVASLAGALVVGALVAAGARAHRTPAMLYAPLIVLAADWLIAFRADAGPVWTLWLVLVVVATDIAGYFAGRIIGGPRFWPQVSPKKTWSGTVAGWLAAGAVGLAVAPFLPDAPSRWSLIAASAGLSLASQMGDIVESAIKRRVGVKDASGLLPGHGGVLDRFDGLVGAALVVGLVRLAGG